MAIGYGSPAPKPTRRTTVKGRQQRAARAVVTSVRAQVAERDGYCRIAGMSPFPCEGPSQWAHVGNRRRFKTRGQPAADRHTTAGTVMLCRRHHDLYDSRFIHIEPQTDRGADGNLMVISPEIHR